MIIQLHQESDEPVFVTTSAPVVVKGEFIVSDSNIDDAPGGGIVSIRDRLNKVQAAICKDAIPELIAQLQAIS